MRNWREFLDSINTPGGQVLVSLVLVGIGIAVHATIDPEWGKDIGMAGLVAVVAFLRGTKSNREIQGNADN